MLRVRPISLNRLFHGIHAPAIGVMPSNPRTRLRHPASSRAEPPFRRSEGSPQYTHPTRVFAQYSIEAPHPHRVRSHPERSRSSGGERDLPNTHIQLEYQRSIPSKPRTRIRHWRHPERSRSSGGARDLPNTHIQLECSRSIPSKPRTRIRHWRHPERSRSSGGERDLPTHIKVGAFALYPIQSPRPASPRAEPLFRRREGSP